MPKYQNATGITTFFAFSEDIHWTTNLRKKKNWAKNPKITHHKPMVFMLSKIDEGIKEIIKEIIDWIINYQSKNTIFVLIVQGCRLF